MKKTLYALIILSLTTLIGCNKEDSKVDVRLPESDELLIIAHRGASAYAPEHTLSAYRLAKELKADYIEIDLQMTKDNHLVAMHDSSVDRTTDGEGKVSSLTLEELKKLDAGSWFNEQNPDYKEAVFVGETVPSLEEIFEEFGHGVNYYIETKEPDKNTEMEQKLVSLLETYGFLDRDVKYGKIVIQSFSEESLKTIHELEPALPLVKLQNDEEVEEMSFDRFKEISEYAVAVGPPYSTIDEQYVKDASVARLKVHPFTVNNLSEAEKLKKWGVSGVFTNYANLYESEKYNDH